LEADSSSPSTFFIVVLTLLLYAFATYAEALWRTYPRSQLLTDKHRSLATLLLHSSAALAQHPTSQTLRTTPQARTITRRGRR